MDGLRNPVIEREAQRGVNRGKVCAVFAPALVPLSIFVLHSEIAQRPNACNVDIPRAGGFTPVTRLAFQTGLDMCLFPEM